MNDSAFVFTEKKDIQLFELIPFYRILNFNYISSEGDARYLSTQRFSFNVIGIQAKIENSHRIV